MDSNLSLTNSSASSGLPHLGWYVILRWLTTVLTGAGNSLVIYLTLTRPRLHTTSNWFILSLSVADLCVGMIIHPVSYSCIIWFSCDFFLVEMVFDMLLSVEVGNMCVMTIDRYLGVVYPLKYAAFMTYWRVTVMIILAWLVPICLSLTPLAWYFSDSQETRLNSGNTFGTIRTIIFQLIPCLVMLLVYTRLFLIVRKQSLRINASEKTKQRLNGSKSYTSRRWQTESSSARVFGLVVLTFVICWSLSAFRHFCRYLQVCRVSRLMQQVSRVMLLANSAINPFVYFLFKKDVKAELVKLMCCKTAQRITGTDWTGNVFFLPRSTRRSAQGGTSHETLNPASRCSVGGRHVTR